MKLSMQSNPDEGVVLISFDDEGREELLNRIETALKEEDHEFGMLGAGLTEDEVRGNGWVLNDFYNIICQYEEKAPLHADTSITISGGKEALADLCRRIRALPQGCREFELQAEPHTPRKRKFRFSWLLGGMLSLFFLIPAADRFFVSAFSGRDAFWYQMWCYLIVAAAVLPMPRLINLRSMWATRVNAFLGLVSSALLLVLNLEIFGPPSNYFLIPDTVSQALLCLFAASFATVSLCAFFRRGLRRATNREEARIKQTARLIGIFLIIAVLAIALLTAGLMHAMAYMEGRSDIDLGHRIISALLLVAVFALPLWMWGEVLRPGLGKRLCLLCTGCTLIPGLLIAAPIYLMEFTLAEALSLRIMIFLLFIGAAISLFFYLLHQFRQQGQQH